MLGATRDELQDAQDNQMVDANKSQCPIDSPITAGAKVFLETMDLPSTYTNVNPMRRKLAHLDIGT
jgi:hypothetical protein